MPNLGLAPSSCMLRTRLDLPSSAVLSAKSHVIFSKDLDRVTFVFAVWLLLRLYCVPIANELSRAGSSLAGPQAGLPAVASEFTVYFAASCKSSRTLAQIVASAPPNLKSPTFWLFIHCRCSVCEKRVDSNVVVFLFVSQVG